MSDHLATVAAVLLLALWVASIVASGMSLGR